MIASGRTERGARERRGRRLGGVDLVPRTAQTRPQRTHDLRLVVDDEHADGRHRASASEEARGSASTKVAP